MKKNKIPRATIAGWIMGKALIAVVNLMYQNNTAKNFLRSLTEVLDRELVKRTFKK